MGYFQLPPNGNHSSFFQGVKVILPMEFSFKKLKASHYFFVSANVTWRFKTKDFQYIDFCIEVLKKYKESIQHDHRPYLARF